MFIIQYLYRKEQNRTEQNRKEQNRINWEKKKTKFDSVTIMYLQTIHKLSSNYTNQGQLNHHETSSLHVVERQSLYNLRRVPILIYTNPNNNQLFRFEWDRPRWLLNKHLPIRVDGIPVESSGIHSSGIIIGRGIHIGDQDKKNKNLRKQNLWSQNENQNSRRSRNHRENYMAWVLHQSGLQ